MGEIAVLPRFMHLLTGGCSGGWIGVSWIGERAFFQRSMVMLALQQEFIAFSVGSFRHEAFLICVIVK